MDRHYIEGITRQAIVQAHEKDLEIQSKYDVHFLTYWFDEPRCTGFCLVDAARTCYGLLEMVNSGNDQQTVSE